MLWGLSAALGFGAATDDLSKLRTQLSLASDAEDNASVAELSRRIIALAPADNKTWEQLARAELAMKDYDHCAATLAAWRKAVKPPPAAIDDISGDLALEKEDYAGAERSWLAFVARKPAAADAAVAYDALADLYVTQSRWAESEKFRAKAIAAESTAARLCLHAQSLLRLHQWDAAAAEMNRAEQKDPDDGEVKDWLPQFERLETFFPRIKALDARIAKAPNDLNLLLDRARLFTLAERPLLALDDCQRAMKQHPESMRARIQAGEALLDTDEPEAAAKLRVSDKLLRNRDKHVSEEAIHDLTAQDAAIAAQPDSAEPLAARAKTLRNLKQPSLALADAQAALAIDEDSAAANFEAARCLDDLDHSAEALQSAVRATELNPNDAVGWYLRGLIEAKRADFAAAIASQTKSIGINESIDALRAREEAQRRSGKVREADVDLARIWELQRIKR